MSSSIKNDLDVLPPLHQDCCIYRVHDRLRNIKPEAYEPKVVSIGPYHIRNPKLQEMKKHKLQYLKSLLIRRKARVEEYIQKLMKLEEKVRKFYADPICLTSEEFVEMMLLDGCFIIEFFRKKTPNPTLSVGWMDNAIHYDMMLLENQLPFFLLSQLYDWSKDDPNGRPFMEVAKLVFTHVIQQPFLSSVSHHPREIKHLLHLVHVFCRPYLKPRRSSEEIKGGRSDEDLIYNRMHSVVELQEAGIKFKKVGEFYKNTINLFGIVFRKGLMEIPCFSIQDSTDTFFRNLIAYEQHNLDVDSKYFTDFASFMNQLINTDRDVELLRLKGIIVNFLGDDHEVSDLFNKLGDGIMVSDPDKFYYSDVRIEVNRHCKRTWNKMMAILRHNYFNTPWASISTIAAAVLLLLTLIQAIASVKTLTDDKNEH